jgi:protein SCO1
MPTRRELITGRIGAHAAPAGPTVAPQPRKIYGAEYFSNLTLTTHAGDQVRFYDDLIRDKVVAVNMMYATCEGICPLATSNLLRVQKLLGERVGRSVFMYSITLLPDQDTPQRLREYVEMHDVGPGWLFLTGRRADIQHLRYRLGFYDFDPAVDSAKETHTGMVRIGNDVTERWTMAASLAGPEQILTTINHVDPSVMRTSHREVASVHTA